MYYVNYFFLYSIFGHILESIIYMFYNGESGILFFPWTPIYGVGAIIVIYSYNKFIKKEKNKFLRNLYIFLVGFFLLSLLEWFGGILIEKTFDKVFWSYDDLKFNFGHYIALEISLCWGIASLVIIKILKFTDKIVKKIPRFIPWLLIILMSIDLILTIFLK